MAWNVCYICISYHRKKINNEFHNLLENQTIKPFFIQSVEIGRNSISNPSSNERA